MDFRTIKGSSLETSNSAYIVTGGETYIFVILHDLLNISMSLISKKDRGDNYI